MPKALSVTQPMAWAIVKGFKLYENRDWRTAYRGKFWIHASKKFNEEHYQWMLENQEALGIPEIPDRGDFIHGAIIGEAELLSLVDAADSPWFEGPIALRLGSPKEYEKPVYCRGHLGFFEVTNVREAIGGTLVADTRMKGNGGIVR